MIRFYAIRRATGLKRIETGGGVGRQSDGVSESCSILEEEGGGSGEVSDCVLTAPLVRGGAMCESMPQQSLQNPGVTVDEVSRKS